jgi:DNA-binding CsgD family transcriptional regulator
MLINDASFRDEVRKIANGFTKNAALQEDLQQEAMIHAWRVETDKPDRTRSWYLQSCRFHLQHWLALGRSVDSLKRVTVDTCVVIDEAELHEYHTNGECFESVSFQDLVMTLSTRLRPAENRVLQGLVNGMRLREVARITGLSYPTALKYRRRIADLVNALELSSVSERMQLIRSSGPMPRPGNKLRHQRSCPKAPNRRFVPPEVPLSQLFVHDSGKAQAKVVQIDPSFPEGTEESYLYVLAAADVKSPGVQAHMRMESVAS